MLVTVVRSGDAPKPPFPIKTGKKLENPENQGQINHRNYPLFPTLPKASLTSPLISQSAKHQGLAISETKKTCQDTAGCTE